MDILLTVQNLEKRGRCIPFIITAHLVNLIQEHQRITHACVLNPLHNPARHGSDIRFSVSPDFSLVVNSAQTNPDILLSQRSGNGAGNGCLSCSGRPDQTENRTGTFLCEDSDCQVFKHPLFDLFKSVMILLQHLLRIF